MYFNSEIFINFNIFLPAPNGAGFDTKLNKLFKNAEIRCYARRGDFFDGEFTER